MSKLSKFLALLTGKDDPVHNCKVYKAVGCAHVDGPLCDMAKCSIKVQVSISPREIQATNGGASHADL